MTVNFSHPPVETLLERHGRTALGRRAARDALTAAAVERANQEANLLGLSTHCQDDTRTYVPPERHRCRNDGSTCLCRCHDPNEEDKTP